MFLYIWKNGLTHFYSTFNNEAFFLFALEQACDPSQKADVAAVVMQEGLANIVLVTSAMTLLRAKVEVTIPRKRKGSCSQHEKVHSIRKSSSSFFIF